MLPVYNEKENIEPIVNAIESISCVEHLVIVDDSTDETTEKIVNLSKKYPNIVHLRRKEKKGLGSAITDGLKYILDNFNTPCAIVMDADFSHNPEDIPRFVSVFETEGCDIIVGSRYIQDGEIEGWNFRRKATSKIANGLAQVFLRIFVKDCTSGYRLYSRKAIEKIIPKLKSEHFEIQIETLHWANRLRLKTKEIPIKFVNRKTGFSKLSSKQTGEFLKFIIKAYLGEFAYETRSFSRKSKYDGKEV
jgi:dolichol-phosphate mannosyltransferase